LPANQRRLLQSTLLSGAAVMLTAAGVYGQAAQSDTNADNTVLLETITVTAPHGRPPAPAITTPADPGPPAEASFNPPSFEAQQRRFERRPGAETVVSVTERDLGRMTNVGDVFQQTPGVFVAEGGSFISMRGSDIANEGSRNGRGIRAYLDGFPLGRTEAGFTNGLIDPLATDYAEVYRGGSSLRYGAMATGGALNFVSKTGRTAPGTGLSVFGGSFGTFQTQIENGGVKGPFDWYLQGNLFKKDGYQIHTGENNYRFSGNVGWNITPNIESRTFFAIGKTKLDMGDSVPLDQLESQRRGAVGWATQYNARLDFDYQRIPFRGQFGLDVEIRVDPGKRVVGRARVEVEPVVRMAHRPGVAAPIVGRGVCVDEASALLGLIRCGAPRRQADDAGRQHGGASGENIAAIQFEWAVRPHPQRLPLPVLVRLDPKCSLASNDRVTCSIDQYILFNVYD
jgi:outer membrane receptor protein involved in Fe transport